MTMVLPKIVQRPKKRLGRGHGSGKVKTSGRGTKGQKARGSIQPGFEGGQLSIIKRLPLLRGKGKNESRFAKPVVLDCAVLNVFNENETVTLDALKKKLVVEEFVTRVKVLGKGIVTHAVTVQLPCSASARQSIEKAGGKVIKSE